VLERVEQRLGLLADQRARRAKARLGADVQRDADADGDESAEPGDGDGSERKAFQSNRIIDPA
jgi:hypothetical protein